MNVIIDAECESTPENARVLSSQGSLLLNLLYCLGYDTTNPPLADLLSQHYRLEGQWLILTPVQWHATHNNVLITELTTQDEHVLKSSFHRFSEHLMTSGMALYYHDRNSWLLSTNHRALLQAKPAHQMMNQSLMHELLHLDDTMYWQKFITESQMFFATLNNPSEINGVWPWGGGDLGAKSDLKIGSDHDYLPLAQLCSSQATLYDPSLPISDYELLLLHDPAVLSEAHQQQLEKITTRWYWNNVGYECSPIPWFTRLWRALIHAN